MFYAHVSRCTRRDYIIYGVIKNTFNTTDHEHAVFKRRGSLATAKTNCEATRDDGKR